MQALVQDAPLAVHRRPPTAVEEHLAGFLAELAGDFDLVDREIIVVHLDGVDLFLDGGGGHGQRVGRRPAGRRECGDGRRRGDPNGGGAGQVKPARRNDRAAGGGVNLRRGRTHRLGLDAIFGPILARQVDDDDRRIGQREILDLGFFGIEAQFERGHRLVPATQPDAGEPVIEDAVQLGGEELDAGVDQVDPEARLPVVAPDDVGRGAVEDQDDAQGVRKLADADVAQDMRGGRGRRDVDRRRGGRGWGRSGHRQRGGRSRQANGKTENCDDQPHGRTSFGAIWRGTSGATRMPDARNKWGRCPCLLLDYVRNRILISVLHDIARLFDKALARLRKAENLSRRA